MIIVANVFYLVELLFSLLQERRVRNEKHVLFRFEVIGPHNGTTNKSVYTSICLHRTPLGKNKSIKNVGKIYLPYLKIN